MPDLIAQGTQPDHRWRRKLQPGVRQTIGREAGPWSTPWDDRISRRHVQIVYHDGRLHVEVIEGARNPVFYRGYKTEQFSLRPGDHFVIGQTTFSLVEERVHVSLDLPEPAGERTFTLEDLRRQPFREADKRIDVLSRLPDIISGSSTDQELFVRLVNLLLSGIERATAAAVVAVRGQESGARSQESVNANPKSKIQNPKSEAVEVLHWDRRILAGHEFRPSERLIRQTIASGESIAHVWSAAPAQSASEGPAIPTRSVSEGPNIQARSASEGSSPPARSASEGSGPPAPSASQEQFTLSEGVDWAFCTPVPGRACAGWALYVQGSFSGDLVGPQVPDAETLRDEVKFAELTAATLSGLRESRLLATRQASLSQFFSPVVLEALAAQEADEALAPREADVTVLFCDLRGFTSTSERSAGDLFGLLQRVSQALGVMTHHILEQGGVVGDFHGDAAMGFWGWPISQPDSVLRACRAALGIRAAFGSAEGLTNFRVGIGIASGRAVAGKIGTVDQVKVTVFGPVVNLAARLETMTKQLRASILIDPPTAAVIRATVPREICRVRRLARVRPVGLSTPLEVTELLPPLALGEGGSGHQRAALVGEPGEGAGARADATELTDAHIASYEAALDAFQARDWPLALKHLHAVPPDDLAKDFLTIFIAQHNRTPPPNWDGAIALEAK